MSTENSNETRVRMNLAANAKGMYQMDVTVESSTVEESKAKLAEAIDAVKEVCKEKGLTLVTTGW